MQQQQQRQQQLRNKTETEKNERITSTHSGQINTEFEIRRFANDPKYAGFAAEHTQHNQFR